MIKRLVLLFLISLCFSVYAQNTEKIFIYMDKKQTNHLRAYGVVYYALSRGVKGRWLLNYRSGSFILPSLSFIKKRLALMNVSYSLIDSEDISSINNIIEKNNMFSVELNKAPKIAVYSPPNKGPWDDAVTMVLTYSKIPYTVIYDKQILTGELSDYDWLHLHHEDFTGQFGKFYSAYKHAAWYIKRVLAFRKAAKQAGFNTVAGHKRAVAQTIQNYVKKGGFLFAMCSATDTIDIALASHGLDIIAPEIDGTPVTQGFQKKLDYSATFAFKDFKIIVHPNIYEFSDIDVDIRKEGIAFVPDTFTLFDFSAKIDVIPTILNQNHVNTVKGFLGQTTAFYRDKIKDTITILGKTKNTTRVKYIHGPFGKGQFTFYAGHDPECYRHLVGMEPTNLDLYPNSPGYRLILNNILFPSARKKKLRT